MKRTRRVPPGLGGRNTRSPLGGRMRGERTAPGDCRHRSADRSAPSPGRSAAPGAAGTARCPGLGWRGAAAPGAPSGGERSPWGAAPSSRGRDPRGSSWRLPLCLAPPRGARRLRCLPCPFAGDAAAGLPLPASGLRAGPGAVRPRPAPQEPSAWRPARAAPRPPAARRCRSRWSRCAWRRSLLVRMPVALVRVTSCVCA